MVVALDDDWEFATVAPNSDRPADALWTSIGGRTTVGGAMRCLGRWSLETASAEAADSFDDSDHWFRVSFDVPLIDAGDRVLLELDGVATISQIFIDDNMLGESSNMFATHRFDVTQFVGTGGRHEVSLRCASLSIWLHDRRMSRAAWRTRLVGDQKLRGVRTTLLGRIPSWSPTVSVVGPWRPVRVVVERSLLLDDVSVRFSGPGPTVEVRIAATATIARAVLHVGSRSADLDVVRNGPACAVRGSLDLDGLARWWPHTHGEPALHDVRIDVTLVDGTTTTIGLGRTGARTVTVDRGASGRGFTVQVNGTNVFCRGASVMPIDVATLESPDAEQHLLLVRLRDAGCNLIRVSGTCAYERDRFFDLCDELGLLVWHDLPFANFDYPTDPEFAAEVTSEVSQFLRRTQFAPSIAVICGGSEVEQQATMLGLPPSSTDASLANTVVREVVEEHRPDVLYVPSSPTGGHLPFAANEGIAHYFGVGAYRRPLADARHADVKFAAECLAFANVPSARSVAELSKNGGIAPTSPRWKAGVPRDSGTGWDFDDVRDHYVHELFGIDPTELRFSDPARYLAVARATSAELMTRTLAEWRRPGSSCAGAIVWFANDLRPGAGWGLLDSECRPKAALHGFAHASQPIALLAIDEGLNGLDLWLCNDTSDAVDATVELTMLRNGATSTTSGRSPMFAPARGATRVCADAVFGHFSDPTYAYRFGPPSHDAIAARVVGIDGRVLARSLFIRPGLRIEVDHQLHLRVEASWVASNTFELTVSANRLARHVSFDIAGAVVEREQLQIVPGDPQTVRASLDRDASRPARGYVTALNAPGEVAFAISDRQQ